jgi:septum formation protein
VAIPTLVLASRSPSRARLLRDAGYTFQQLSPRFQDPANPQPQLWESPAELAQRLARDKARSVFPNIGLCVGSEALILTADTLIVAPHGGLLGQPRDRREAQAMLESLVERIHRVVTAVCLAPTSEPDTYDCFADEVQVSWVKCPQTN